MSYDITNAVRALLWPLEDWVLRDDPDMMLCGVEAHLDQGKCHDGMPTLVVFLRFMNSEPFTRPRFPDIGARRTVGIPVPEGELLTTASAREATEVVHRRIMTQLETVIVRRSEPTRRTHGHVEVCQGAPSYTLDGRCS